MHRCPSSGANSSLDPFPSFSIERFSGKIEERFLFALVDNAAPNAVFRCLEFCILKKRGDVGRRAGWGGGGEKRVEAKFFDRKFIKEIIQQSCALTLQFLSSSQEIDFAAEFHRLVQQFPTAQVNILSARKFSHDTRYQTSLHTCKQIPTSDERWKQDVSSLDNCKQLLARILASQTCQ